MTLIVKSTTIASLPAITAGVKEMMVKESFTLTRKGRATKSTTMVKEGSPAPSTKVDLFRLPGPQRNWFQSLPRKGKADITSDKGKKKHNELKLVEVLP